MNNYEQASPTDTAFNLEFGRLEKELEALKDRVYNAQEVLGRALAQREYLVKLRRAGNRSYHLYRLIIELADSISIPKEDRS